MTPQEKMIVQATFESARQRLDMVGLRLYGRLFERYPGLRQLFPEEMDGQHSCFNQMLAETVKGLEQPDDMLCRLKDLGARHIDYGVQDEYYDALEPLIITSVRLAAGIPFSRKVYAAWRAFYRMVSTAMREGARTRKLAVTVSGAAAPQGGKFGCPHDHIDAGR